MKNTTLLFGIVLIIVLVGGFIFFDGNNKVENENSQQLEGEVQKVIISEKNFNYYPNEIRVKAGQPVEISLDSSVKGCFRSFTVRDLGIAKNLPTPSDSVKFTPDKKGTYTFACSMGMGYGKLIVE